MLMVSLEPGGSGSGKVGNGGGGGGGKSLLPVAAGGPEMTSLTSGSLIICSSVTGWIVGFL